jgi:hypothetical protein
MKLNSKGEFLLQKMRAKREVLVKKYESAGTIRYDEAIGLIPVGGNPAVSQAPAAVGGAVVANNGRRETRIVDFREDGASIGTRVVLDLAAIKAANIADGIPSGSMMDALKKRAEGKTILLFADDAALRYGTIILGTVPCQLKLMGDIVNAIRNAVFPGFQASNTTVNGFNNTGAIHALPGFVEQESLTHRGFAKPVNYRGDVEYLKDPTSIWATVDASRQPIMLFGINSEIRMWGEDQVIDLNGFRIGAHERPNRVAAFSSIIDLSDGHFSGLTTKGAKNAHIYSSAGKGRLARNNHFAIRGHFVKGLLVENVISGDADTINHGSYFVTAILNDSSEIVFKSVHQEMLNKAVSNSSMALSHYAQLTNIEVALGYFERPSTWATSGALACPWMKWDNIASGAADTFGNGKTTRYPVIKTAAELEAAGVAAGKGADVAKALRSMQLAHRKSMKSADDTYISVNTGHNALNVAGANRAGLSMDSLQRMTDINQIPRSANLIAQNPRVDDGFRYPDSVAYGFRVGSAAEGVGPLATQRGGTVNDIYIMDCSFQGMHLSPMEMTSLSTGKGLMKTFNGNGLRPFGYSNTLEDAASMAPSLVLMSKAAIEAQFPASKLEPKPVDSFDTAAAAVANYTGSSAWTAQKAQGLYKGNDVVEAGLAALEAIGLLKKYFTSAIPKAQLSGLDNSATDIGILALRKSMMTAIGAHTANHIGLKGGFGGDIFMDDGTYYGYGEIYPWFVSADESVSSDKDDILAQANARTNRRLTTSYISKQLPDLSDSLYKLKFVSKDTVALVTADSETPVTYEQCISLLGFGSGSGPVQYKIARSVDGQNHVHKGAFGVRADQASRVLVKNVKMADFETHGKAPISWLGSEQVQKDLGITPEDRPESGVMEIHGVSINGVTEAKIEDVQVVECDSRGSVYGVEIAGKSTEIELDNVRCETLSAGQGSELRQPFGDQKAVGVRVLKGTSDVKISKVKSEDFEASRADLKKSVEIESEEVSIS